MKPLAFLFALLPFCVHAGGLALSDISPHLSAETKIIWKAPTNALPRSLWTYRKQPQHFSPLMVSNALLLGEFKLKPFPKSFAKQVTVWDRAGDPQPDYFTVEPNLSLLSFRRQRHLVAKGETNPAVLISRTWRYAAQLGLDKTQLAQDETTENLNVSLARKVDGIPFNQAVEGFSVGYGAHGEILNLSLSWPKLERVVQEKVIGADEIIRCIRAFKTPVLPGNDEPNYFNRIKSLASIRTLTITNITPYYTEGRYGEQPSETEPEKFVEPMAILEAVADWGKSNAPVKLAAPLITSDVKRLLAPAQ